MKKKKEKKKKEKEKEKKEKEKEKEKKEKEKEKKALQKTRKESNRQLKREADRSPEDRERGSYEERIVKAGMERPNWWTPPVTSKHAMHPSGGKSQAPMGGRYIEKPTRDEVAGAIAGQSNT